MPFHRMSVVSTCAAGIVAVAGLAACDGVLPYDPGLVVTGRIVAGDSVEVTIRNASVRRPWRADTCLRTQRLGPDGWEGQWLGQLLHCDYSGAVWLHPMEAHVIRFKFDAMGDTSSPRRVGVEAAEDPNGSVWWRDGAHWRYSDPFAPNPGE